MDPSTQYQYQPPPHDPSQGQPYNTDQSAQAYYQFHQYNQYLQQQQYPYYPQDYTNAHQQSYQEPTSVHPPGVPVTAESQTHVYNQHNPYYTHGIMDQQQAQQQWQGATVEQQWQGNSGGFGPLIGQTAHTGGGRMGGRPYRGRGTTFRGRGRGRGRGGSFPAPAGNPAASVRGESSQTPVWPPPRMAWCELCRVDCNTAEILEQHKNGKKHKKNLLVYEELQKRNAVVVGQNEQIPVSEVNQGVSEKNEVSDDKVESEQQKVPGEDRVEGGARGLKRKMRGGRGAKWIRTHDGSKRPMEPPKPKPVVIPLVCELCNVKCDSQVVFQAHLAGKKHLSNVKRFQGEQAMLEQAALQALYPALQAILEQAAIQALRTPNPNASTSFGIQFHGEGGGVHGSQGVFPQVGTLMFPPPGQASTPGPGTTSALAQNQPSGAGKTESENGTSEVEQKDVNHQADNPVVGPAGDTVTGAEKLCDSTPSDHHVAETDNNVEELGSSSKE